MALPDKAVVIFSGLARQSPLLKFCSAKPDGLLALLAQAATTNNPTFPHGEQETRQGGQKFSLKLPGSAQAQEFERRTPITSPTIAADRSKFPRLFLPFCCSLGERQPRLLLMVPGSSSASPPIRLGKHTGAQHSSSCVLGWRPLLSCAAGRVVSRIPSCFAHGTRPLQGSQVSMLANGKHLSPKQTALLQKACCSSKHLSLVGVIIQRQPQH